MNKSEAPSTNDMHYLLLIDKDTPFRARLAQALRDRRLEVVEAENPDAARGQLATTPPDGIVLDLRWPGGRGLEFVRELRATHHTLPIVVLTSFGSIATAIESVRSGATDYLTKPADTDTVLAALRGTLPRRSRPSGEVLPEIPSLGRVEWEHIQRVLTETGGNISQAARLLALDRRSLQRKLAKNPPMR
ncbi:MAG: response regulator [Verrucomicrobiota bacterium]